MTRDERKARALQLVAGGATQAAAAREVGVSHTVVWHWLHPEVRQADNAARHQAKLAWAHEHDRGRCPCGAPTAVGSRRNPTHKGHCQSCRLDMQAVEAAWRRQAIYEMWHEGFMLARIALELDSTVRTIGAIVVRMRQEGWDMPYRRRPRKEGAA